MTENRLQSGLDILAEVERRPIFRPLMSTVRQHELGEESVG